MSFILSFSVIVLGSAIASYINDKFDFGGYMNDAELGLVDENGMAFDSTDSKQRSGSPKELVAA